MGSKMRQAAERSAKPENRKIGEKAVRTLSQITRQMRLIFCEARNGQIDVQTAGTLVRILERLRMATASSVYDVRLAALEEHLNARARERGVSNGERWHD